MGTDKLSFAVEQWRAIGSNVTGSIIIYIGIGAFALFIYKYYISCIDFEWIETYYYNVNK